MLGDETPVTAFATDRKITEFTSTLRALVNHFLLQLEVAELVLRGLSKFFEKIV